MYFNKHSNLENDLLKHIEEMKKSGIQEILKLKTMQKDIKTF